MLTLMGDAQAPATQTLVPVHLVPHAPQFCESMLVSVQTLLQTVAPQATQSPALHASFAWQTCGSTPAPPSAGKRSGRAQPPQFFGSFAVSTRFAGPPPTSPQLTCAPETQTPLSQCEPAPQTLPQPPQLFGSLSTARQAPRPAPVGQSSWPAGQFEQAPLTQACCGGHCVPHAPQFSGSFEMSVHVRLTLPVLESVAPHSLSGAAQAPLQMPDTHAAVPPSAGAGQANSHAPQWFGSVVTSMQVPLQSFWLDAQPGGAPFLVEQAARASAARQAAGNRRDAESMRAPPGCAASGDSPQHTGARSPAQREKAPPLSGVRLWSYLKLCSTRSCCSYLCEAALPVAGLALSGREAQRSGCARFNASGQRACR